MGDGDGQAVLEGPKCLYLTGPSRPGESGVSDVAVEVGLSPLEHPTVPTHNTVPPLNLDADHLNAT